MRALKVVVISFVIACTAFLAGCSYRPLYGKASGGGTVAAALSGISVEEQKSRAGQLVRNRLISGFGSAASGGQYVLRLEPGEKTTKVSSVIGQKVQRFRYRLSVNFALLDSKGGAAATEGTSFSTVSYDTVDEPISDMQAADTARERAAHEIAEDIRTRLAAFLASGS